MFIDAATAEIDGNGTDDANGVEAREQVEVAGDEEDKRGQEDGGEEGFPWDAEEVEFHEAFGEFIVARHDILDGDHVGDGGVDSGEEEEAEDDAADSGKGGADVFLGHDPEDAVLGVFLFGGEVEGVVDGDERGGVGPFGVGFLPGADVVFLFGHGHDVSIGGGFSADVFGGEGVHGDGEDEVKDDDFEENGPDGLFAGGGHGLHHDAGHVGDGFDAGEGQDHVDQVVPHVTGGAGGAMNGSPSGGEGGDGFVRDEGGDGEEHGEEKSSDGDDEGEGAGFFRADEIDNADQDDAKDGEGADVEFGGVSTAGGTGPEDELFDLKVVHAIHRGEGGGDDVIGEEQECADDREDFAGVPRGGVDAAAIGIAFADDGVGPADGGDESADTRDIPEAGMLGVVEGEAQHVEAAGAPVAVEHGAGVIPFEFARTFSVSNEHAFFESLRAQSAKCTGARTGPWGLVRVRVYLGWLR